MMAGVNLVHLPYRGGGLRSPPVIVGQVQRQRRFVNVRNSKVYEFVWKAGVNWRFGNYSAVVAKY
jgi:hypothetical protein